MLKHNIGSKLLIFCLLLLSQKLALGQKQTMPFFEGPKTVLADSLFKQGEVERAIELYKQFAFQNPHEGSYQYKLGIAYLHGSVKADMAISHLSFASDTKPNIVNYYLGLAHHFGYDFEKALEYYRDYLSGPEDSLHIPAEQVENLMGQCENGLFMLKYIYQPKIVDKKRVATQEMYQYIVTRSSDGGFVPRPKDLITDIDREHGVSDYLFFPNKPEYGDKVVFSSYGNDASNGKDLYMMELLRNGLWSKPKSLGDVINTPMDEDFPYLAPDGVTLYFASKGHYSMGGYDIYRAIYNPSTSQWSIPENLGFPFSSPGNDFLFVPNREETYATFLTSRYTCADSVDVVLVEMDENPIRRTISSLETIKEISGLIPAQPSKTAQASASQQTSTQRPAQTQGVASFTDVENDPEYLRALTMGFNHQLKADSLREKLEALREKFDFVTTAEQRIKLEREVFAVEDSLLKSQRNADIYFVNASKIEQEYLVGKRKPQSGSQSSFTADNPDYLYQAQYAPTVFRQEELVQLQNAEKIRSKVENQREALRKELNDLDENEDSLEEGLPQSVMIKMGAFNRVLREHVYPKKALYLDCIAVALMKAGVKENDGAKKEVETAKSYFRAATTIRNNAIEEHVVESEYEALLMDELGVLRLEIAFAKLWGINLFEQQLISRTIKLEREAFGMMEGVNQRETSAIAELKVVQQPLETEAPIILRMADIIPSDNPLTFEKEPDPSFVILEPKDHYQSLAEIPSHLPLPKGVVYRIQLAAFSKAVNISTFNGISPLWAEPIDGGRITKYYAGDFRFLNQAEKAQAVVRQKGFKDAFVVAWHNGRTIPLARAKQLEETEPIHATPSTELSIDMEEDDNKLYIINLGSYAGAMPADVVQTIRTLAPGKDIVRKSDSQGGYTYTVGSYGSKQEAQRVKDNIVASGLKDAFLIVVETEN